MWKSISKSLLCRSSSLPLDQGSPSHFSNSHIQGQASTKCYSLPSQSLHEKKKSTNEVPPLYTRSLVMVLEVKVPAIMQSRISDHIQAGYRSYHHDLQVSYQRTLSFISLPEQRLKLELSGNNSDFTKYF